MAEVLLHHGAAVNQPCKGETPLSFATSRNKVITRSPCSKYRLRRQNLALIVSELSAASWDNKESAMESAAKTSQPTQQI